uniref:Uncharacterized protein n=1 Tax=Acrobeloides nanus TaxID=290746 RepID=A0A914DGK1_9BILA
MTRGPFNKTVLQHTKRTKHKIGSATTAPTPSRSTPLAQPDRRVAAQQSGSQPHGLRRLVHSRRKSLSKPPPERRISEESADEGVERDHVGHPRQDRG